LVYAVPRCRCSPWFAFPHTFATYLYVFRSRLGSPPVWLPFILPCYLYAVTGYYGHLCLPLTQRFGCGYAVYTRLRVCSLRFHFGLPVHIWVCLVYILHTHLDTAVYIAHRVWLFCLPLGCHTTRTATVRGCHALFAAHTVYAVCLRTARAVYTRFAFTVTRSLVYRTRFTGGLVAGCTAPTFGHAGYLWFLYHALVSGGSLHDAPHTRFPAPLPPFDRPAPATLPYLTYTRLPPAFCRFFTRAGCTHYKTRSTHPRLLFTVLLVCLLRYLRFFFCWLVGSLPPFLFFFLPHLGLRYAHLLPRFCLPLVCWFTGLRTPLPRFDYAYLRFGFAAAHTFHALHTTVYPYGLVLTLTFCRYYLIQLPFHAARHCRTCATHVHPLHTLLSLWLRFTRTFCRLLFVTFAHPSRLGSTVTRTVWFTVPVWLPLRCCYAYTPPRSDPGSCGLLHARVLGSFVRFPFWFPHTIYPLLPRFLVWFTRICYLLQRHIYTFYGLLPHLHVVRLPRLCGLRFGLRSGLQFTFTHTLPTVAHRRLYTTPHVVPVCRSAPYVLLYITHTGWFGLTYRCLNARVFTLPAATRFRYATVLVYSHGTTVPRITTWFWFCPTYTYTFIPRFTCTRLLHTGCLFGLPTWFYLYTVVTPVRSAVPIPYLCVFFFRLRCTHPLLCLYPFVVTALVCYVLRRVAFFGCPVCYRFAHVCLLPVFVVAGLFGCHGLHTARLHTLVWFTFACVLLDFRFHFDTTRTLYRYVARSRTRLLAHISPHLHFGLRLVCARFAPTHWFTAPVTYTVLGCTPLCTYLLPVVFIYRLKFYRSVVYRATVYTLPGSTTLRCTCLLVYLTPFGSRVIYRITAVTAHYAV